MFGIFRRRQRGRNAEKIRKIRNVKAPCVAISISSMGLLLHRVARTLMNAEAFNLGEITKFNVNLG